MDSSGYTTADLKRNRSEAAKKRNTQQHEVQIEETNDKDIVDQMAENIYDLRKGFVEIQTLLKAKEERASEELENEDPPDFSWVQKVIEYGKWALLSGATIFAAGAVRGIFKLLMSKEKPKEEKKINDKDEDLFY